MLHYAKNILRTNPRHRYMRNVHDIPKPLNVQKLDNESIGSSVKYGSGGRSSVSGLISTVFGCTGFLGKYVVSQFAKRGDRVVVPYRGVEDGMKHLKVMGDLGQIIPMEFDGRNIEQLIECVKHSDVVVNLIGQNSVTRNFTLEKANCDVSEKISKAIKMSRKNCRLLQISTLNASKESFSEYHRTKWLGEEAVKKVLGNDAYIIRLATVFGDEDYFLNRIGINKNILLITNNAKQTYAPIYVLDAAKAIELISRPEFNSNNKIIELTGPREYEYRQIIDMASQVLRKKIKTLNLSTKMFEKILGMFKMYPYRILRPEEVKKMEISEHITQNENIINTAQVLDINSMTTLESRMVPLMGPYRSINLYQMDINKELLKPPKKREIVA